MILFKAIKTPEQECQGCHEYEERCHEHVPDTHETYPPLFQLSQVKIMLQFESLPQTRSLYSPASGKIVQIYSKPQSAPATMNQ
jgi:hypothetical protein